MIEFLHRLSLWISLFVPMAGVAENLSKFESPTSACSTAIGSYEKIGTKGLEENTIPKSAVGYINLLEQTLGEISDLNVGAKPDEVSTLQIQILQTISESQAPVDPLQALADDPAIAAIFYQSHLLRFLISAEAFRVAMVSLTNSEWIYIRNYSENKISSMQAKLKTQAGVSKDTRESFVEIAPDSQGRVRLHYLIEQRSFLEALALLQLPGATTRYVNTRDKFLLTPLDIFNRLSPRPSGDLASALQTVLLNKNALSSMQILLLEKELIRRVRSMPDETVDFIEFAYQQGADLNFQLTWEGSALTIAAKMGKLAVVKELLRYDVELNIPSWKGPLPILRAVENRHSEIVKLLGTSGAEPKVSNELTLAEIALIQRDAKTFRVLAELGFHLQTSDSEYPTTAFRLDFPILVETEDSIASLDEILQILKDYEVDLSQARPSDLSTPAHLAIHNQSSTIFRALAKYGADLDKKDKKGKRPLDYLRSDVDFNGHPNWSPFGSDPQIFLFGSDPQIFLEIFYNYYAERGIPPSSRGIEKKVNNGETTYSFLNDFKLGEGFDQ